MSEANTPSNHQGQSDSSSSMSSTHSDWENPFPELADDIDLNEVELQGDASSEANPFKFGGPVESVDGGSAAQPDSLKVVQFQGAAPTPRTTSAPPTPMAAIAAWSETLANQADPPDLADLISLIQELNQCNSILLDRVSQLEEALEHSQTALQSEVGRLQDYSLPLDRTPQNQAIAQEQNANLFNQLEFAHQTNQRQQILIETLTGQLENSQERVAQLEREAALIQQRYSEQSQSLAQSENTCRDLQARLQRQQRYTLQFKVALEKCLEVPTPQYESAPEVSFAAQEELRFLPKVQRIQPWSSQAQFSVDNLPWASIELDLTQDSQEINSTDSQVLEIEPQLNLIQPEGNVPPRQSARSKIAHLKLPSFSEQIADSAANTETDGATPQTSAPNQINLNIKAEAAGDPALMEKLDAAVQPLADLLADAILADTDQPSSQPASLQSQFIDSLTSEPAIETSIEASNSSAEELLKSVMTDAEDALWQDLARLIDASTEDVVKASLSGDFSAFEAIDFEAVQQGKRKDSSLETEQASTPIPERSPNPSPTVSQAPERNANQTRRSKKSLLPPPAAVTQRISQPTADPSTQPEQETESQEWLPGLVASSSWPSPIVYPLRPTKKRQSLAMVDLPTFQHQEASADSLTT